MGMGGGYKRGEGGGVKFYPCKQGAGKVLAVLKEGGTQQVVDHYLLEIERL